VNAPALSFPNLDALAICALGMRLLAAREAAVVAAEAFERVNNNDSIYTSRYFTLADADRAAKVHERALLEAITTVILAVNTGAPTCSFNEQINGQRVTVCWDRRLWQVDVQVELTEVQP
jgi:hypothetical protein